MIFKDLDSHRLESNYIDNIDIMNQEQDREKSMVSSIANTDELRSPSKRLSDTASPMATQNRSGISSSVKIDKDDSFLIEGFLKGVDQSKKQTKDALTLIESQNSGQSFENKKAN
jgi:hypothetical protein